MKGTNCLCDTNRLHAGGRSESLEIVFSVFWICRELMILEKVPRRPIYLWGHVVIPVIMIWYLDQLD